MPMSRRDLDTFRHAHRPRVRATLALKHYRLQPADQDNVEQEVWIKVMNNWPETARDDERRYLATIVVNAIREHHRKNHRKKDDARRNVPMIDEGPSGPIDCRLVDPVNVAEDVDLKRLRDRLDEIAALLPAADAAVFRRMMVDVEDVPKRERERVLNAVRVLLRMSARPRSVEHPDIVEGPSHCGRALRRIREERAASDEWDETTEELDAAE